MRSQLAAFLLLGALGALGAAPARAAEGEWRLVAVRAFEHHVIFAGFLDERSGVTVGAHGMAFYSADGGQRWEEGTGVSSNLYALELLPDGFAWNGGNRFTRRSFNGGRSWYLGADFGDGEPDQVRQLSFADEVRGFVATATRLGVTADGGVSWTELRLPAEVREIAAVSMALAPPRPGDTRVTLVRLLARGPVVGRVLDAAGRLWRTDDGGASWREEPSPLAGKAFLLVGRTGTVSLRFTGTGEGVLAALVKEEAGLRCRAYRLPAGQVGWKEEPVPLTEPGTLFLSPDARLLTWKSFDRDELRLYARP